MSRPIHEVKPLQARLVRSWETRLEVRVLSVLLFAAELAQSVERKALNLVVVGSSPTVGAFCRSRALPRIAAHTTTHAMHAIHTASLADKLTLAGLEPAIFGSEDQRLIH